RRDQCEATQDGRGRLLREQPRFRALRRASRRRRRLSAEGHRPGAAALGPPRRGAGRGGDSAAARRAPDRRVPPRPAQAARASRRGLVLLGLAVALLPAIGSGAWAADGGSSAAPTIASDKADYMPGETVTLSGTGWQPGEAVQIVVNDDAGSSWSRVDVVTAAA